MQIVWSVEGYFLRLQNAFDTLEAKRRIASEVAKISCISRHGRCMKRRHRQNVSAFHALGLADADDLVLRADLMQKIEHDARARSRKRRRPG